MEGVGGGVGGSKQEGEGEVGVVFAILDSYFGTSRKIFPFVTRLSREIFYDF